MGIPVLFLWNQQTLHTEKAPIMSRSQQSAGDAKADDMATTPVPLSTPMTFKGTTDDRKLVWRYAATFKHL